MRKLLVWGLTLAIIAGAVAGVILWRQRRATQTVPEILRSAEVEVGDLAISVSASGNTAVSQRTDVMIRLPGRVDRVLVAPNERVIAGQVLAVMDTQDLERAVRQSEIALAQAELSLSIEQTPPDEEQIRLAELAVNSAAQTLEVARIGKQTAQIDADALTVQAQRQREAAFSRYREASDGDATRAESALREAETEERIAKLNAELLLEQADSQWQAAYTQYQQAQQNLDALRAGPDEDAIRQIELQIDQAQLRLDQAHRALDDARITAPHDGIVAAVYIQEGARQSAGQPAFTLLDDSTFYVDVTIDEIDIGAVEEGQDAEVTLDAYPDVLLSAIVDRVAPGATALEGLVLYPVRLRIGEVVETRMLDGMTSSVRIETDVVRDILLIPNWAVHVDQQSGETYCYRLDNGIPTRATVELGRRNDTHSEVLSGLVSRDIVGLVVEGRTLLESFTGDGPSFDRSSFDD